jgi:cutinase-like protein
VGAREMADITMDEPQQTGPNARRHRPGLVLAAVAATSTAMIGVPVGMPSASAAPCPDVEVVFARGTNDAPGVGDTGQAFIDALRSRLGDRSLGVYAVNYPASLDFPTAADGVIDASSHVQTVAANCPATEMVLGGYSQGAAVIGYITSDAIPDGYIPPPGITGPMPASVTLFGRPSNDFLARFGAPPITIGQLYKDKTIDVCAPGDPVCSIDGYDNAAHVLYASDGMDGQAVDFALRHLDRTWR